MKLGEWNVRSVLPGRFRLDGGAMFGVVPRVLWQRVAPPDEQNRIAMATRLLLIEGRGRTVIVDTGCGLGYGEKLERIYGFEGGVPMAERLAPLGVSPADVTDVLITHLHFDHGGGVVRPQGSGWELTFENARHHIQRRQWEHALDPNPRDQASYFRERIEIIERTGVLELHDGDWEMDEGVELLTFHGHTPGQHLPKITGAGTTLFYCGDLIPTSHHLATPYVMAYDLEPLMTMEEKPRLLVQAAADNWILFFEHDVEIEACRVESVSGRIRPGEPMTL